MASGAIRSRAFADPSGGDFRFLDDKAGVRHRRAAGGWNRRRWQRAGQRRGRDASATVELSRAAISATPNRGPGRVWAGSRRRLVAGPRAGNDPIWQCSGLDGSPRECLGPARIAESRGGSAAIDHGENAGAVDDLVAAFAMRVAAED